MDKIIKRLANFISVKSFVTVVLTIVFAYLAVTGVISPDYYMTVFTVVIGFYFGTQSQKIQDAIDKDGETK